MLLDMEELTKDKLDRLRSAVNADHNPIEYISIDPGKSNGVCGYDSKFYTQFMYTIRANDMVQFLNQFDRIKTCIIENFILYPEGNKKPGYRSTPTYSDMETSRVIGRVESWGVLKNIEVVKQNASIKPTGYLWIGQKPLPKSNPRNHVMDAHVHFMYWAVKNHKIDAADLLKAKIGTVPTPKPEEVE